MWINWLKGWLIMGKREYDYDAERLAEALWIDSRGKIVDVDTFDMYWDDFFKEQGQSNERDVKLKPKVFRHLKNQHPEIRTTRTFKEAGGRDLRRDRKRTAKEVVTRKEDYKSAQRQDLSGLDTKGGKKITAKKPVKRKTFSFVGKRKGKIVYARKTFVVVKGKRQARFRDKRGVFVSVKKKK